MNGLFGDLFDLDQDGAFDSFEQATEFAIFSGLLDRVERREALEDVGLDPDDYDE